MLNGKVPSCPSPFSGGVGLHSCIGKFLYKHFFLHFILSNVYLSFLKTNIKKGEEIFVDYEFSRYVNMLIFLNIFLG